MKRQARVQNAAAWAHSLGRVARHGPPRAPRLPEKPGSSCPPHPCLGGARESADHSGQTSALKLPLSARPADPQSQEADAPPVLRSVLELSLIHISEPTR